MPTKIRGIHVSNKTCWRTEDLWGFLRPLVIAELEKAKWKGLTVYFQPGRGQRRSTWRADVEWCGTSGYADWRFNTITINLPTVFDELNQREKVDLASTIAHELWHINTRRGGKAVEIALRKSVRYGRPKTAEGQAKQAEHYAWAAALPLRKKAAVVVPVADAPAGPEPVTAPAVAATVAGPRRLIQDRAAKAAAALARWEAELVRREKAVKRAKRKVSAARRKAAYYAKKTGVS